MGSDTSSAVLFRASQKSMPLRPMGQTVLSEKRAQNCCSLKPLGAPSAVKGLTWAQLLVPLPSPAILCARCLCKRTVCKANLAGCFHLSTCSTWFSDSRCGRHHLNARRIAKVVGSLCLLRSTLNQVFSTLEATEPPGLLTFQFKNYDFACKHFRFTIKPLLPPGSIAKK